MQKRRLILPLLLFLYAGFAMAEQQICVSMTSFDDSFLSQVRIALADEAQKKDDIHLFISDARWQLAIQKRHIAEFIHQPCDAIILNLVSADKEDVLPVIQPVLDAGIPIVFVNVRPNISMGNGLYYVGSDDYESGSIQMNYLINFLPKNAKIGILMGSQLSGVAKSRTMAVKKIIETRPDLDVVAVGSANFERQKAIQLVTKWIEYGIQFDAVVANNDEMALGALQAMKKNGLSPYKIKVVGIDATEEALYSMYKHELFATVFQDAEEQGRQALQMASALAAKSTKIPAEYIIPYQLVNSQNFRIFMRR